MNKVAEAIKVGKYLESIIRFDYMPLLMLMDDKIDEGKKEDADLIFKALSILKDKEYKFNLLLLGPNIDVYNKKLLEDIKINNIQNEVIFIKKKSIIDISKYFSYLDLYILCSKTEGFPNILGEAIINGINVLSTDVGDAKLMVPSKKNIVHNSDAMKFSKKIENLLNLYRLKKIQNNVLKKNSVIFHRKFSQNKMLYKYQKIWKTI